MIRKNMIVKDIEKFVSSLYVSKDAMHDINHIYRIIKAFEYLEKDYVGQFDREAVIIAAYLHGIINDHEKCIADWLQKQKLSKSKIQDVIKMAKKSQKNAIPRTLSEKLLHDAHMIEGGKTFLVIKSLITGVLRDQSLSKTISYFKKNVLNLGKCYLPRAIKIRKQQRQFAIALIKDLNYWLNF
jgi:uncharacterized protein